MDLSKLLVIETGPGLAGPLVARTLGDFGARVIKVESNSRLDFGKARLPPPGKTAEDALEAPGVIEIGGSKQSVTLNLKTDTGRDLFLGLIKQADVYVETYAPGWLERLGLSVEMFLDLNSRLVVLSQSAYGGDGPMSDQRAYAPLMTAMAGLESTVGYDDGRIVPQIASAVGDVVAANFGSLVVLAALYERERTGRGQIIDESQTEASAAMACIAFAEYGLSGEIPTPCGNCDPFASPHGVYPAGGDDAWVALAVWTDAQWQALCDTLEFSAEERELYANEEMRLRDYRSVDELVAKYTRLVPRDLLYQQLQEVGVACTPVLNIYEAEEFPTLVERRLWSAFDHPRLGELRMTEIPWHYDHVDLRCRGPAEPIGASTTSVLKQVLGAQPDDIEAWRRSGALD